MDEDYASYLVKGSTVIFLSLILSAFAGFLLRVLLARSISTAEYGLFFAVFEFVSFFGILRHLGLNQSLTKFLPQFRAKDAGEKIKDSISTVLGLGIVFTSLVVVVLVALSGWLAANYFNSPTAVSVLVIVCGVYFAKTVIQTLSSTFAGFKDMLGRQLGDSARTILTLVIVAALFLFLPLSVEVISIGYLLAAVLAAIFGFIFLKKRHAVSPLDGSIALSLGKKFLKFGLPLALAGVAGSVMGQMDTMMITAFRPLRDVGYYQVARPAARTLGFIGGSLSAPMLPLVSELWEGDERKRLSSVLSMMAKLSFLIVIPASMVFIAFPEVVIRLLFGSQYIAGSTALRILGVGMIFQVGGASFAPTLTGTGNPSMVLKASGIGAIFNLIANLALVPNYGAGGAAVATSLSFLISNAIAFYYARKVVEFPVPVVGILKILLGGGIMLGIVTVLKAVINLAPLTEFFVVILPSLVLYLIWVFRTGGIDEEGLDLLERTTPVPSDIVDIFRKLAG